MKCFARTLCVGLLGVAVSVSAVPPVDSIDQRVRPCTACHDEQAIDLESGYVPRLHGKPVGYLFNQLVNYREARRRHQTMQYMVGNLSDDYLWEMAQYFVAHDAPYPPPASDPVSEGQRELGRMLVTQGDASRDIPACQSCHGERLTGVQPNTPGLIGLPRVYIAAQLGAWRAGTRRAASPDCMHQIAERMTGQDIQAVSAWLAAHPVPAGTKPIAALPVEPPMECGSVSLPGR